MTDVVLTPVALKSARSAVRFALIASVIATVSGGLATAMAGRVLFTPEDDTTAVARVGAIFDRAGAPRFEL